MDLKTLTNEELIAEHTSRAAAYYDMSNSEGDTWAQRFHKSSAELLSRLTPPVVEGDAGELLDKIDECLDDIQQQSDTNACDIDAEMDYAKSDLRKLRKAVADLQAERKRKEFLQRIIKDKSVLHPQSIGLMGITYDPTDEAIDAAMKEME